MNRTRLVLLSIFVCFMFSGCSLIHEAGCGINKDYVCGGPELIEKVDGMYTVSGCGCVTRK